MRGGGEVTRDVVGGDEGDDPARIAAKIRLDPLGVRFGALARVRHRAGDGLERVEHEVAVRTVRSPLELVEELRPASEREAIDGGEDERGLGAATLRVGHAARAVER